MMLITAELRGSQKRHLSTSDKLRRGMRHVRYTAGPVRLLTYVSVARHISFIV